MRQKKSYRTLRGRLLWLAAEWELYADREEGRARRAYKDAAAALRRELNARVASRGGAAPSLAGASRSIPSSRSRRA